MTKQLIMTSPTSYGMRYEINHWMKRASAIDQTKAVQQWSELRNALVALNVDVIVTPRPPAHCPDAVFVSNAGIIVNDSFIPSRMKFGERADDAAYYFNWMMHYLHVEVNELQATREQLSFDGAGDALFDTRNNLWMGFGNRTTLSYKYVLDKFFENSEIIVRPLELVDEKFYSLDTCFCPLDTGEAMWYPPAFSEHAKYVIESMFEGKLIEVSGEDALKLACNSISVGKDIVTPFVTPELNHVLTSRGYTVHECDMSEFIKGGGACKSLTLDTFK